LHPFEGGKGGKGVAFDAKVVKRFIACIVHIHFFTHECVLRVPQGDLINIRFKRGG
jgi:hypothetical protein